MGTEVAGNEVVETAETAENEVEETVEEGSVAVEEESLEGEEDEEEEEKEEEDDPERLSELEILPGKTAYINFYYTIDPEIEGMKDQKVDFSFTYNLEDEEGKQTKNTLRESFRYAVDALNLMTVTAGGEKGYVETGKEDEMLLEFDLGLMREVLEEAVEEELEKTENGDASAAEAKRASASELLVGWEDENGERPLGKKDPAVIKNLKCEVETFGVKLDKFKAVPVKDDDNFGTSLKCNFYVSRKTLPGTYYGRVNASYKIKGKSFHTTQGFKVVVKQETGEMELVGKIGDSEIVMTGPVSSFPKADELSLKVSEITQEQQEKVDEALQKKAEEEGTEINQYKALDIKLMADGVETEPEGDVQVRFKNVNLEKVDEKKEAEQEKAEEQSIVKKAVRKVMSLFSARTEEEDVATVAETGTEGEEKTEAKDTEDAKAEGSEEAAGETGEAVENSENIKVLHLDEDAVVANEMKSEVKDNGDVVMDTDHFSIYVLVDLGRPGGQITVTLEHYAGVKTIAAMEYKRDAKGNLQKDSDGNFIKEYVMETNNTENDGYLDVGKATDPTGKDNGYKALWDGMKYKKSGKNIIPTNQIYDNNKQPGDQDQLKDSDGNMKVFGYYTKDQIYDRYTQDINTRTTPTKEIYSSQTVTLPNELKIDNIEDLSKVFFDNEEGAKKDIAVRGYNIDTITVIEASKEGSNEKVEKTYKVIYDTEGKGEIKELTYTETNNDTGEQTDKSVQNLILTKDCTIRFTYIEKPETVNHNVKFYDHNVSDGGNDTGANQGINNSRFLEGKNKQEGDLADKSKAVSRMESGQQSSGNTGAWNNWNNGADSFYGTEKINNKTYLWTSYWTDKNGAKKELNSGNTSRELIPGEENLGKIIRMPALPIKGIVESKLVDNKLQYDNKIAHPDFFSQQKNEDKYASRLYDNYQLGFQKTGDTYVLSTVSKDGNTVLSGLDDIHFSTQAGINAALFSNEFWPLDAESTDTTENPGVDERRAGKSDDGGTHNWHFGMTYSFDFTVGDYKGPMNFYFRGDDDFWMYVDGELVIDLGGIHSAVGEAVDMKAWLQEPERTKAFEDKHHVDIYFMERGGFGSCCYMQYTLPNCNDVDSLEVPTLDIEVEKKWEGDPNNFLRPEKIVVELLRKVKGSDEPFSRLGLEKFGPVKEVESGALSDTWKCSWSKLPKVNPNSYNKESNTYEEEYIYKLQEQNVFGYETSYEYKIDGKVVQNDSNGEPKEVDLGTANNKIECTITNTLSPKVRVEVRKNWKDGEESNQSRPASISMQLQYKKYNESDDKYQNYLGNDGVLTLNAGNDWHGFFENLPYYINEVRYEDKPKLDGYGKPVFDDKGNPIMENVAVTKGIPITYRVREVRQNADGGYTILTDNYSNLPGLNGYNYTVTYEDIKKFPASDPTSDAVPDEENAVPRENTVVATTIITNTLTRDMSVVKNWEDVPSDIKPLPTAKIGLFKQVTKEDAEGEDIQTWEPVKTFTKEEIINNVQTMTWNKAESEDFLFEFVAPSSLMGTWKNIPKYDQNNQKITYGIFEVDSSGKQIEIPKDGGVFTSISGYKFIVSERIKNDNGELIQGDLTGEKDGTYVITNKYMVDLIVTKQVDKKDTGDKEFSFTASIELDNGNQAFILPNSSIPKGKYITDVNGSVITGYQNEGKENNIIKVSFKLKKDSKVIIPVPVGSKVTIKEDEGSHSGYHVSFTKDGDAKLTNGDTFTIEGKDIDGSTSTINVICTNTPGAVLPDTGGPGLLMMSRLGWMLLLLALLMAGMEIQFYGERRNRKMANVQREDTRGFDPDDY